MSAPMNLNGGVPLPVDTIEVKLTAKIFDGGQIAFHMGGSSAANPSIEMHPLAIRSLVLDALAAFAREDLQRAKQIQQGTPIPILQ